MAIRTITPNALTRYTDRAYGPSDYRPIADADALYVTVEANDGGQVRLPMDAWLALLAAHARLHAALELVELWRKRAANAGAKQEPQP